MQIEPVKDKHTQSEQLHHQGNSQNLLLDLYNTDKSEKEDALWIYDPRWERWSDDVVILPLPALYMSTPSKPSLQMPAGAFKVQSVAVFIPAHASRSSCLPLLLSLHFFIIFQLLNVRKRGVKPPTCSQIAPVIVTGKGRTFPRPRFSRLRWLLKSFSSRFSSSSKLLQ